MEQLTKSQLFIQKYKKQLVTGPDFFNLDSCLMKPEEFYKRKHRFLLIAPTPALTKSVSATFNVINSMFCEEMDWFFDIAYLPEKKDLELYDKMNVPYCIGQISHLDASHFDIVGFSISVLHEILTAPVIVKSFQRCDKPIPLTWTERKDKPWGTHPLLLAGGITAAHGEVMFGELGDGRQAYLDLSVLGICDNLKSVCSVVDSEVEEGDTIQDVIDKCFKFEYVYQPQAYRVVYKDNLIVENTKINPKAQDFVKPLYPKHIPERLGVGRTIVTATGTNAGDTQVQLSESCTGGRGTCFFSVVGSSQLVTNKGLISIEKAFRDKDVRTVLGGSHLQEPFEKILRQSVEEVWEIKTSNGQTLKCSADHKCIHYPTIEPVEVKTKDLKVGSFVMTYVKDYFEMAKVTSVKPLGYSEQMYDVLNTTSHLCVFNGILTHQCAEGNYSGSWQEAPMSQIQRHARETKKWTAAISCKPLSFNCNHVQDFTELIYELNKAFPKVTYINMRLEELAHDHEAFRMMKYCLSDKALSIQPGVGLVRQSEIVDGPIVGYDVQNAHYIGSQGKGDAVRVKLSTGTTLEGTPDHPVMVRWSHNHEDDYKKLKELSLGDRILLRIGTQVYGTCAEIAGYRLDEDMAALLGWYMGDGYISVDKAHGSYVFGCCFNKSEREIYSKLWEQVKRLGLSPLEHVVKSSKEVLNWRVNSKEFVSRIEPLVGKTSHSKRIPSEILRAPQPIQAEFLKYWYAADAMVQKECRGFTRVTLCSVNRQVLEDAQVMLFNMGVLANIKGNKTNRGTRAWYLDIQQNYLKRFKEAIGIAGVKGNRILAPYGKEEEYVTVKVVSVETLQNVETYGVSVEKTHSYVTNGVLSHNTGASRLSAPIEGLSDRIRNGFMNKNLSKEAIEKMFTFLLGQGISDLKVGLVWSGFESEDDWKEIRELVGRLKSEAASLNKKLPFRLKATALVYYPGTPLEISERLTSKISWKGERYFTDEMYEENKKYDIHIKINGFRGSTFIEQALVDLGGSITHWIHKNIVVPGTVCFNTRPIATDELFPSFKRLITNPEGYFGKRHLESYISPFHRIRLDLEGGIIAAQRRLEKNYFEKEPTGKCLYSYDGCKTKCFHGSMKKAPYVHWYDVKLVNGHLVGEKYDLVEGCDSCESPEEMKMEHLKRPWRHKYSVSDLEAQVVTRTQIKYRIVLKRNKEYSLVSPLNTAHTAMACLLRQSDVLLDNFWDITSNSLGTQMSPELVYDVAGIQIVDYVFKAQCLDEITRCIPLANKELRVSQIISAMEIPMFEKLSNEDYNVYKFECTGIPSEVFINGKVTYRGGIRVLSKVDMQAKVVQQVDKFLEYPVFKVKAGKIVGTFALPKKYNPYLFFQEVLSERKMTQKAIQACTTFEVVTVLQVNSYVHCKCGKPMANSAITGKPMGKCPSCLAKLLASKM